MAWSFALSLSTIYVGLPTIFILLFFLFSSFFFLSFSDALIRDTPESAPSLSLFSFLFLNKVAAAAAGLGAHTHKKEISRHCFIVRDGRVFRVFPIEKEDKIRLLVFYFWFFCVISFCLFVSFAVRSWDYYRHNSFTPHSRRLYQRKKKTKKDL